MKKQVNIRIESNLDGEKSNWETLGYYEKVEEIYTIEYVDYTGNTITNNTLKVNFDMVELTRRGTSSCEMLFQAEKKHKAYYQVMTGNIDFEIYTREYVLTTHESGLDIFLDYFLEEGSGSPIHNYMKITLEEVEDSLSNQAE